MRFSPLLLLLLATPVAAKDYGTVILDDGDGARASHVEVAAVPGTAITKGILNADGTCTGPRVSARLATGRHNPPMIALTIEDDCTLRVTRLRGTARREAKAAGQLEATLALSPDQASDARAYRGFVYPPYWYTDVWFATTMWAPHGGVQENADCRTYCLRGRVFVRARFRDGYADPYPPSQRVVGQALWAHYPSTNSTRGTYFTDLVRDNDDSLGNWLGAVTQGTLHSRYDTLHGSIGAFIETVPGEQWWGQTGCSLWDSNWWPHGYYATCEAGFSTRYVP